MSAPKIVLASGSRIRADILGGAGVSFEIIKPGVDEDEIKTAAAGEGIDLETLAGRLADAKCLAVAASCGDIIIGSDQIMAFDGQGFDKPASMADARERLVMLAGKTHTLINAITVAHEGNIVWRDIQTPKLTMRSLSAREIDAYLQAAGPDILSSVGAYQVEKLGARLFEKIEGDYFAVLGLSLYPLLGTLRKLGAIEF